MGPMGPDLDEDQDLERLKERRFHRNEVWAKTLSA
jgi:hypothetical protein